MIDIHVGPPHLLYANLTGGPLPRAYTVLGESCWFANNSQQPTARPILVYRSARIYAVDELSVVQSHTDQVAMILDGLMQHIKYFKLRAGEKWLG